MKRNGFLACMVILALGVWGCDEDEGTDAGTPGTDAGPGDMDSGPGDDDAGPYRRTPQLMIFGAVAFRQRVD